MNNSLTSKKQHLDNEKHHTPVLLKGEHIDSKKFMPLPKPTGKWPYRLNINSILADVEENANELTFNLVGDTGSAKDLSFQRLLAQQLIKQATSSDHSPQFLYHVGDIVYDHGEEKEYAGQFFKPFEAYPGPIFSIPGNHDAEINPASESPYESLDAYMKVFCTEESQEIPFSRGSQRKSMTQPHVYWTLDTPLATIIGLYGNVAKFGVITEDQRIWFIEELKRAATIKDKVLIVCLHQSPFSADTNHGSSLAMINFLEDSYNEAGIKPDIVFSGHVHNYQRFTKRYADGSIIPYVVVGAGGYATLHSIADLDDPMVRTDLQEFRNVRLQNYCTDKYGFLKLRIVKRDSKLKVIGEYYTVPIDAKENRDFNVTLYDHFEITLKGRERELAEMAE